MRLSDIKFNEDGEGINFWPRRLRDGTFLYVYRCNDGTYFVGRSKIYQPKMDSDILNSVDYADYITAQCALYELAPLIPNKKPRTRHP